MHTLYYVKHFIGWIPNSLLYAAVYVLTFKWYIPSSPSDARRSCIYIRLLYDTIGGSCGHQSGTGTGFSP